jgi:CubicO group peptidase (beta-lactamase class C family)
MKKVLKSIAIITGILVVVYFLMPEYVRLAVRYWGPSIDDYKIFHNRVIEAGEYHAWELHENYNQYEVQNPGRRNRLLGLDPIAALVIQDQKILYEEYWDGYSDSSYSNSFSAGKAIVSLLVGIALDEGKIKSLNQPVGEFLPSYNEGLEKQLTIRHLLTMSSGLDWQEEYSTPFSPTAQAYYGSDINALMNDMKIIEEPGKEFDYLSGNTQLLAMVLESATGQRISHYASERLWKRIGARDDALWNLDREDGMEKAYCCFNTNVRDYARFGQLLLNKGLWNGNRIISEAYLEEATTPKAYLTDKETGDPVNFYGFQWWIINYKGHQIPYMRGILGQYIFVIPDKNAVVVRLGHKRSSNYAGHHPQDVVDYLDGAFSILY